MRTTASYLRLLVFLAIAFVLLLFIISPEDPFATLTENWFWAIIGILTLIAVAAELCIAALQAVLYRTLSPDAKKRYDEELAVAKERQFKWFKERYAKMLGSRPLQEEHEIVLDHNYDGIKELDNNLPPWWVYMFYATILFGAVYLIKYHVLGADDQAKEYLVEVAEANIAIAKWKETAKDLVDINTVTLLSDAADMSTGKSIFNTNCVACHKIDGGGGIGPNLTDSYWILGGGIKNVFKTISEGGRDGKGMISWKSELKPKEMAQVASYVLSLEGTTAAEPKAAEGELWVDPDTTSEEVEQKTIDSTATTNIEN